MPGRIVVQPSLGLCNRLLVISSFAALAERTGRRLEVCWTCGPGWSDEDIDGLFEPRFPRVDPDDYAAAARDGIAIDAAITVTGTGGVDEDWHDPAGIGVAALRDSVAHPLITYAGHRPVHGLVAPEDRRRILPGFKRDLVRDLRTWQPVREIRELVAEISGGFGEPTVGVHIRRGDAILHPGDGPQYRRSSDAAFLAQMERTLRRRPSTAFFLATDSPDTELFFRERFGTRILVNDRKRFVPSVPDAAKENQCDAVVDLFALARTSAVLGTYYSTFSQTAAMLGPGRLRVVLEDSRTARAKRAWQLGRHEATRRSRRILRSLRQSR